jgi:hypothetical protein
MASSREARATISLAAMLCACGGESGSQHRYEPSGMAAGAPMYTSLGERPCPSKSRLDYENFGGPFFLDWCAGCHSSILDADHRQGAPAAINFDTIDDIRAHSDRIWARAADQNDGMPPIGGPPGALRSELGEWLACGAPARVAP